MFVARRKWTVVRSGRTFHIESADEYFFGERVVRVDGAIAYRGRTVLSDHSGAYQFDLGGGPAYFHISSNGLRYFYDLIIDGRSVDTGQAVPIPDGYIGAEPAARDVIVIDVAILAAVVVCAVLFSPVASRDVRALILLIAIAAAGAVSSVWSIRNVIHHRRVMRKLREFGVETNATITGMLGVRRGYRSRRITSYRMAYSYMDPDGATYHGGTAAIPLSTAIDWPVGSLVRIRYDPERPSDSLFVG